MPVNDKGFTLIEVLTAMAVLGISVGLVIALFAGGLRSAGTSQTYSRALLLARYKMDEGLVIGGSGLSEGEADGTVLKYKWKRSVSPFYFSDKAEAGGASNLYSVEVKVSWKDGLKNKEVALQSLMASDGREEDGR